MGPGTERGGDPCGNTQLPLDVWSKANPGPFLTEKCLSQELGMANSMVRKGFQTHLVGLKWIRLGFW